MGEGSRNREEGGCLREGKVVSDFDLSLEILDGHLVSLFFKLLLMPYAKQNQGQEKSNVNTSF